MMYGKSAETEHLRVSKMNDDTTICQQETFDFFGELHPDPEKLKEVRKLLRRYKAHNSTDAENRILAQAMENYRLSIEDETDERRFNVLMLFYFSVPTLTAFQISRELCMNDRTVFKDISKGVEELCVLIFGIDAFTVAEQADHSKLSSAICKCIYNAFGKEV